VSSEGPSSPPPFFCLRPHTSNRVYIGTRGDAARAKYLWQKGCFLGARSFQYENESRAARLFAAQCPSARFAEFIQEAQIRLRRLLALASVIPRHFPVLPQSSQRQPGFLGTPITIKATGEDTGGAFSLLEQLAPPQNH
jgi:hypothetical protein